MQWAHPVMTSAPRPTPPAPDLLPWRAPAMCALIFGVTLLAYLSALRAGFIWDDMPGHVTRPELQSVDGLVRIWFELGATQQYYPLLHSFFWFQHQLWGDAPFGYHLVNLLLHATAACLVGTLLRRLNVTAAWLAALLFALHPVMVESVAWVSEQKNTLSAVLYLCAALAFLRYERERTPGRYGTATGLFLLALLTKTVTATLPAALLVICWWRSGRLRWREDVLPLLPWFGLSAGAGILTATFEHTLIGAHGADFELGFVERVLLAGRVVCFYVGKLLWPANLVFVYPRWDVDATVAWQYLFPLGVLAGLGALWWRRGRTRGPLAAALLFGGTLFPALGFINVFPFVYSFVADHFQYLAAVALFALAAAGWAAVTSIPLATRRLGAAAVLAVLAALTWRQSSTYRDVVTLYRATLARNPDAWMAHNNLAIALVNQGQVAEAITHYEHALRLRPGFAEARNNFGYALTLAGRPADAVPHLQAALHLQPKYAEAQNNLGRAYMAMNRPEEGRAAFAEAVRLNPNYAIAQANLGLALATAGRTAEAIPHFERAVRLDPKYADAELNWAIGLSVTGDHAAALPHFERAATLAPQNPGAHFGWGRTLAALGRLDDAVVRFRTAVELAPGFGEAHFNLAIALRQLGRTPEAERHLMEAQRAGFRPR